MSNNQKVTNKKHIDSENLTDKVNSLPIEQPTPTSALAAVGPQHNTDQYIAKIHELIPLEEIANKLGLKLQRSGDSLQGHCPTGHPSVNGRCFSIDIPGKYWNCFSCNEGGDGLELVKAAKSISFRETLNWFAAEFPHLGPVPTKVVKYNAISLEDQKKLDEARIFAQLYELLFAHCQQLLFMPEGKDTLDYLVKERKYDLDTVKKSIFAHFPGVTKARTYLRSAAPEHLDYIDKLPLTGAFGDHFELIFPYRNRLDKITGLMKRSVKPDGVDILNKEGKVTKQRWDSTKGLSKDDLFNLNNIKSESVLIVEGYPDAVYGFAAGIEDIVAVGQGRLSVHHIPGLIAKGINEVTFAFDNDKVGPQNTEGAVTLILQNSKITPFVLDPSYYGIHKDPDEYIKGNGVDAFNQLVKTKTVNGGEWLLGRILSKLKGNVKNRTQIMKKALALLFLSEGTLFFDDMYNTVLKAFKLTKTALKPIYEKQKLLTDVATFEKGKNKIFYSTDRYLPFIDRNASDFGYYDRVLDDVQVPVKPNILERILNKEGKFLPSIIPVLTKVFNPLSDEIFDIKNENINMFRATKYMLFEANDEKLSPKTYFKTIWLLLSNLFPRFKERRHFLNWLACILQTRKKLRTTFVLKGPQGAGKNVFFEHIIQPLFGKTQTGIVEDSALASDYNGYAENKLFIGFNEVTYDNNSRNRSNSRIKAMVTDPTIDINEKYVRRYTTANFMNTMFFSNDAIPLLIEDKDRRFNIISCGPDLKTKRWFSNPEDIFSKIKAELPKFAQFLMNWVVEAALAETIIENKERKALQMVGMTKMQEFVYRLRNKDVDWFEDNIPVGQFGPAFKLNIDDLEKNRIEKDLALNIYNAVHKLNLTKAAFSKYLDLHGVESKRIMENGKPRTHYYTWK